MKEWLVFNKAFLRFPAFYALFFVPTFLATLIHFVSFQIYEVRTGQGLYSNQEVLVNQEQIIQNYLFILKIASIVIIILFIIYRWANFRNSGTYGFWLTQGISRQTIFLQAILIFTLILFSGQFLGLISFLFLSGIQGSFGSFVKIVIILLLSNLFIVQLGMVAAELFQDPEVVLIALMSMWVPTQIFLDQIPDVIIWFIYPEQYYGSSSVVLVIIFNIIGVVGLLIGGIYLHLRADIEL